MVILPNKQEIENKSKSSSSSSSSSHPYASSMAPSLTPSLLPKCISSSITSKVTPEQQQCRVRFSPSVTTNTVDPHSSLTETEKQDIWYNFEELSKFRRNAQDDAALAQSKCPVGDHTSDLCFLNSLKRTHQGFPRYSGFTLWNQYQKSQDCLPTKDCLERLEQTRGLEIRINPERLRNRHISRLAVLEVQRRLKARTAMEEAKLASVCNTSPVHKKNISKSRYDEQMNIAKIARRFSGWAREIALRVGQMDAAAASSSFSLTLSSPLPQLSLSSSSATTTKIPATAIATATTSATITTSLSQRIVDLKKTTTTATPRCLPSHHNEEASNKRQKTTSMDRISVL